MAERDVRTEAQAEAVPEDASAPPEDVEAVAEPADTPDGGPEVADPAGDDERARMQRERDEYLDALRRLQADFDNFRKRTVRQQTETLERAAGELVTKLLPVLDAVDLARQHDASEAVEAIAGSLLDVLGREGLERIEPTGAPFDPTEHDAVVHESGEGPTSVVEVLRAGYRWKGKLLRPAMVKAKGA